MTCLVAIRQHPDIVIILADKNHELLHYVVEEFDVLLK